MVPCSALACGDRLRFSEYIKYPQDVQVNMDSNQMDMSTRQTYNGVSQLQITDNMVGLYQLYMILMIMTVHSYPY